MTETRRLRAVRLGRVSDSSWPRAPVPWTFHVADIGAVNGSFPTRWVTAYCRPHSVIHEFRLNGRFRLGASHWTTGVRVPIEKQVCPRAPMTLNDRCAL